MLGLEKIISAVIQRLLLTKTYTDLVSTFEVKHGHGQL
jgi:hypothetical protein